MIKRGVIMKIAGTACMVLATGLDTCYLTVDHYVISYQIGVCITPQRDVTRAYYYIDSR